ncbi:glycosyltransferase [Novosphingobium sp.]|uniref:glycosyltransferase n=1 Tax=Novosphingobium sp. TaxID=1874826 RepID=UPI00286EA8AC|nr:glycosyltransferase [Novosphingobium sp.]
MNQALPQAGGTAGSSAGINAGRAAFLLPDMGGGGTERLTVELANGFAARGAQVDCVLMQARGEFLPLLDPAVRVVDLGVPRLRHVPGALRAYLKRETPDALLAAMWPLTSVAVLATRGLAKRPRLLLSDHCPLLEQYAQPLHTNLSLRLTAPLTYRAADGVIAVSQGLAQEMEQLAHLPKGSVQTIWNPIERPANSTWGAHVWDNLPRPHLLAMGKLKAEKNFALLIRAFAEFAAHAPGTLAIVGEGQERAALEALVGELGLDDRVVLPGFCATPGDWYAGADLFVLSSNFEGFGNVMVEAMHYGLPVVATDCPHGPAEALGGGRWGTLVPMNDPAALAKAMADALEAPSKPILQRARAGQFSATRAVDAYWQAMFP